MKVVFLTLAVFFLVGSVSADYTVTIDPDLDYYDESGVTPIPQAYQANPTVTTLRDLLITVGIMSAAPSDVVHGEVWQNDLLEVWQDDGDEVWQDYTS